MNITTPPIVPPIITANGTPWTPVEAAPVWIPVGDVLVPRVVVTIIIWAVPVPGVAFVGSVIKCIDDGLGTPIESLEAEILANVP